MHGNIHGVEYWKPEEWKTLFELKDVLNCTNLFTNQAQYGTEFTGAFGPLIHHTLMNSLRFNYLFFIYTSRVTKIPTMLHGEKPLSELILIGKDTLR